MSKKVQPNIMLLDDDTLMLKLLSRQLLKLGFTRVSLYSNGNEALTSIGSSQDNTDLILLDLNMPELDGIEFVRYLVERRYQGSLVFVSGEDERMLHAAKTLVKAHRIPCLGYVQKPVDLEAMAIILDSWSPKINNVDHAGKYVYSADQVSAAIQNLELVNYYQPKVNLATGKVVGVETLVRWESPQYGLVYPDQFIGIAESYGLIDALTRCVLSNAFKQAKLWHLNGIDVRIAINVSMDNLISLPFANYVVEQAILNEVLPQQVVLEVTESRLMHDHRVPLEILTRLRLKRFEISIDDFGTGHSSLSQLSNIPFDELKIDQSFVHCAGADETLRAIVMGSISLARALDMKVVAEGVEDRADWDFVQQSKCDMVQGYFIAKPMPAEEFHDWIEIWKSRVEEESLIKFNN